MKYSKHRIAHKLEITVDKEAHFAQIIIQSISLILISNIISSSNCGIQYDFVSDMHLKLGKNILVFYMHDSLVKAQYQYLE